MNPRRYFHERRVIRPFHRWIVPVAVFLLAVAFSGESAGSEPTTSTGVKVTKSVPFVRESIDEIRALAPFREKKTPENRAIPFRRLQRRTGATRGTGLQSAGANVAPPSAASAPAPSAPELDDSFAGLGNPPHSQGDVIPPDTMGAAGPNHLVSILNSDFGVFDKTTGAVPPKISLDSFWGSLGTAPGEPANFPFDPKILYDPHSGRFVAVTLGGRTAPGSWVMIAISSTSNPLDPWDKWAIDADRDNDVQTVNSADFPGLGVDNVNVYVTANMFSASGSQYSKAWVIPKAQLLAGSNPITWFEFPNPPGSDFTMQPAHTFGTAAAEYFLFEGSSNSFSIARIVNTSGTPVWHAPAAVPIAPYIPSNRLPGAPQSGNDNTIDTSDTRLLNVVYRNGSLWTTHTVQSPATVKTEVAWYQIDPVTATVLSQGRIGDPARWYYYPSIGVNANGDVAVGMSGSSATEFAGGYYTARRFADPAGTMQPVSLLKAGEQSYYKTLGGTENRWGDYSATVVDPKDDLTFWTLQEYAQTPDSDTGASRWGTWWGSFRTSDILSPDNFVATLLDNGVVRLTWTDRATSENAYVVERRVTSERTFLVLATLPPNSSSYTDNTGVAQGIAYYYRVGAVGTLGTAYSDEVQIGNPAPPSSSGGGGCLSITRSGSGAPDATSLVTVGILLLPACALGLRRFSRRRKRAVPIRHPLC